MVGNGDEEKLKEARKTILYVFLGIIVMWLAYSLVTFITQSITKTAKSNSHFAWLIPEAQAQSAYTENQAGSFAEYKSRIQAAIEELESELRIHEGVQISSLQNIKQLVQAAYDRLPDKDTTMVAKNESAKRLVDMYLSIAMNNPKSSQKVGEAISRTATFINSAQIGEIQGSIIAAPLEGNAPLATSFRAQNIKDPSGAIPPASNYIWWIRENGGVRRELGR